MPASIDRGPAADSQGLSPRMSPVAIPSNRGMGYKVFVGGLPLDATNAAIMAYFSAFGKVLCAWQQKTSPRKHKLVAAIKERGFGFVCFADEESAQRAIGEHEMNGRIIEAKPAVVEARDGSKVEGSRAEDRVMTAPLKVFVRWSPLGNSKDAGGANVGYESDRDLLEAAKPYLEGVVCASILFERDSLAKKECGFLTFDTPSNAKAALRKGTIEIEGRSALRTTPAVGNLEKHPLRITLPGHDSSIISASSIKPMRRVRGAGRRARRELQKGGDYSHGDYSHGGNPFTCDDAHWQGCQGDNQGYSWPYAAYPSCGSYPQAYPQSAWAQMMQQQQLMTEYRYCCAISSMMNGCAMNYGYNAPLNYCGAPQIAYDCSAMNNNAYYGYNTVQGSNVPYDYYQSQSGYNTMGGCNAYDQHFYGNTAQSDSGIVCSEPGYTDETCPPVQEKHCSENDMSDGPASLASRHNTVLKEMADSSDENFPASDESDEPEDGVAPETRQMLPHLFAADPAGPRLGCESHASSISGTSTVDDVEGLADAPLHEVAETKRSQSKSFVPPQSRKVRRRQRRAQH